ncbi:MAG: gliding motility-associatede transport system auxiliary component [Actinomycetota bacterium]
MTGIVRRVVTVVLVVMALAVCVTVAEDTRRTYDLTAERSLSLSEQTERVVRAVERDTQVIAFVGRDDPGRAEISSMLGRYRRLNQRIEVRLLDSTESPGEASRLGVEPSIGGLVVTMGDEIERASIVSEQDVTAALARLVRDNQATVCFLTGHGEADPTLSTSDGMASVARVLTDNGYQLDQLDLLTDPQIPKGCTGVVVAAPRADLGPAADVIAAYLRDGGRGLVLSDPASNVDLTPLVAPYGMGFVKGFVLEGDPSLRLPGDPFTLAVLRYRSTSPVVRRLPPTLFPGAEGMTVDERSTIPGLSATPVLRSSDLAYLETEPSAAAFDPAKDKAGPVVFGGAADLSGNFGGTIRRTRVVALGDVDWATNAYVGEAGNAALFVQAMDWLTLDEDLVSVSPNLPRLRALELSDARTRYARLLTAGLVPMLFLLVGALVWALRRGR